MSKYRATIKIVREFDTREEALEIMDIILSYVPVKWEIRTEDVQRV